jgi:hypothetical protein
MFYHLTGKIAEIIPIIENILNIQSNDSFHMSIEVLLGLSGRHMDIAE